MDLSAMPKISEQSLIDAASQLVSSAIEKQKQQLGSFLTYIQRMLWLQTIDHRWKEHLHYIDRLREGIGLRGYAQKDPIVEYKKEAFNAFEMLLSSIKREVAEKFMRVQIVAPESAIQQFEAMRENPLERAHYQGAGDIGTSDNKFENKKMRVTASSRLSDHEPKLNRQQRRKQGKRH
jgi:preprotein translocase subunit SecA